MKYMSSFEIASQNLKKYFQEIPSIASLFETNPERGKDFAVSTEHIYFDYSRQRASKETIESLCKMAEYLKLKEKIDAMFSGKRINQTENRAVLHIALRNFQKNPIFIESDSHEKIDVMPEVSRVLDQVKIFSEQIRNGAKRGATGKKIKNILCIGIGGSYLGPEYLAIACKPYAKDMNLAFLANIDGTDFREKTQDINPKETMVIVISKTFTTAETMQNANSVVEWMESKINKSRQEILSRHFIAVSSDLKNVASFGIEESHTFALWDWVGGRFSASSAVGALPLSLYLGFDNFHKILEGAHWMDQHFLTAPFRTNIPVISGLLDIWNIHFLGCKSRALLPYSQGLSRLAAYTQQGEMESNGKCVDIEGNPVNYDTGEVIFGEPGTNGQHSFYQLLHQGKQIIPCDFIGFVEPSYDDVCNKINKVSHHEELMTNFFAQPDALAFGKKNEKPHENFPGNRPSSSALLQKLTPFTAGLLLAWTEHRIAVKGFIWGINSFDQYGVELGKKMGKEHRERIIEYKKNHLLPSENLNSSTKILLEKFLLKKIS